MSEPATVVSKPRPWFVRLWTVLTVPPWWDAVEENGVYTMRRQRGGTIETRPCTPAEHEDAVWAWATR